MLEIFHHLICYNTPFRKLAVIPLSSKIYSNRRQKKSNVCATLVHVNHLFHRPFEVSKLCWTELQIWVWLSFAVCFCNLGARHRNRLYRRRD